MEIILLVLIFIKVWVIINMIILVDKLLIIELMINSIIEIWKVSLLLINLFIWFYKIVVIVVFNKKIELI